MRDWGLIDSALERPAATVFGEDAYASVFDKVAALQLSVVTSHPLVDGNKRTGLALTVAFLFLNDLELAYEQDEAYAFVMSVADGSRRDVADVARVLRRWAQVEGH